MPITRYTRIALTMLLAIALSFIGLTGIQAATAAGDATVTVVDSAHLAPIPGAFVSVIATSPADSDGDGLNDVDTGSVVVGGPADSTGVYSPVKRDLSALDDGSYGLVVSASGYQSTAGTLTIAAGLGSATVKLTTNSAINLTARSVFGGSVNAVVADGRSGTFYASTAVVPGVFRTTDFGGTWSPVSLVRDEGIENGVSDGLLGLTSSARVSNLITSRYPGEVAVTVGNVEWYSRDFGTNWHSFPLPAGSWDSITWAHGHAADTSEHVSLMVFTSSSSTDMAYATMPTGITGSGIGAAGKLEPTITAVAISGSASFKQDSTDIVAVAAGASSVFFAVQQGSSGTSLYEIASTAQALNRATLTPTAIPGLKRDTSAGNGQSPATDLVLFGGQANVDGVPSSILIYDRTSNNGLMTAKVRAASLYPDVNGNDVWTVGDSLWVHNADGTYGAATGDVGSADPATAPNCGEGASAPTGSLANMFATLGNPDLWAGVATTASVRSCIFMQVAEAANINGTDVPAGAILATPVANIAPEAPLSFDAGFDFGQTDEVMLAADANYGTTKSATWLASTGDGSVQSVDAGTYAYQPLFATAGNTTDAFIFNQASAGADVASGGFSNTGLTAANVAAVAFNPSMPTAQLVGLDSLGGNRTLMSLDDGASYFTVGQGSTAVAWWQDSTGQDWIAGGNSSDPAALVAVRRFSPLDLANSLSDLLNGSIDDPNYLGTRLNLSDSLPGLGVSQFKLSALNDPKVLALQA